MAKGNPSGKPTVNVEADVAVLQAQHAQEQKADGKDPIPLTGVEAAELLAMQQPPAAPAQTKYKIRDRVNPDADAVTVTSPDGTIEDAVRAFNTHRKEIRTAKQLIIEAA